MIINLKYLDGIGYEYPNEIINVDEDLFGHDEDSMKEYVLNSVLDLKGTGCIHKINDEYVVLPTGVINSRADYGFISFNNLNLFSLNVVIKVKEDIENNRDLLVLNYELVPLNITDYSLGSHFATHKEFTGTISGTELDNLICIRLRSELYKLGICEYTSKLKLNIKVESPKNTRTFTKDIVVKKSDDSENAKNGFVESLDFFKNECMNSLKEIILSHVGSTFNCIETNIDISNVNFSLNFIKID